MKECQSELRLILAFFLSSYRFPKVDYMSWMYTLIIGESVAQTIILYSFVIAIGVLLGKIKVFRISLGITFVLFAGIVVGHFGFRVNHLVLDFAKDFGLILFVFSIGLQVGPGFFASFRKGGLTLNLLAMSIVFLGVATAILLHYVSGISMPVMVGILSGAVTNTPGLGAAQQAMNDVGALYQVGEIPDISLGYAVAYPFGVLGIIASMLFLKWITRTDIEEEIKLHDRKIHPEEELPEKLSVVVTNPVIVGRSVFEVSAIVLHDTVITRISHEGEIITAKSDSMLQAGDLVLLVAQKGDHAELVKLFGAQCKEDLATHHSKLMSKQILVTRVSVSGKSLESLKLRTRFGINITRIYRAGIELMASPKLKLQLGDKVTVVGEESAIDNVAHLIGNSIHRLNEPNLFPIFIGILLGVVLGSIPFVIQGIPTPIKLGLAGGPLIVAILLSKYGYKLSLASYTTPSANLMLREIGIVLFLASVGIKAGERFIPTLASGDGFVWMGYGVVITLVPLLLVGIFTKVVLKRSFFEVCGLLSGSTTDPPALAFANSIAQSEAPAVAYATVYSLVMFLRILSAQLLLLLFS